MSLGICTINGAKRNKQMSSGTLKYVYKDAHEIVWLMTAPSMTNLKAYANALQPYTSAVLQTIAFIQTDETKLPGTGGSIYGLHEKGRINLKRKPRKQDSTDFREIVIPMPLQTLFDYDDEKGIYVVKKSIGEACAQAYSNLTGITYEFTHGRLSKA